MSELRRPATADPFARDVYTVSRLNLDARAILEEAFSTVWIEGEVSNLARPRSGHMYFTLKDESCQVRCAMFRMHNRTLSFAPEDGMQVLAHARVGLYPERGEFQLIVQYMEEAGAGALRRAFDALKNRLGAEGLFDAGHKRPLPVLPRCVGVVTSPTGAAVRDVLSVLGRRFPAVPVVIHPVPVQGAGAAEAIARMIDLACERSECDVLILARGGGSLEDLWSFNEEVVARAMHRASIPIVTGVGHEVDFTIADLVADLRAPTPSAAAESVVPDASEWAARYRGFERSARRGHAPHAGGSPAAKCECWGSGWCTRGGDSSITPRGWMRSRCAYCGPRTPECASAGRGSRPSRPGSRGMRRIEPSRRIVPDARLSRSVFAGRRTPNSPGAAHGWPDWSGRSAGSAPRRRSNAATPSCSGATSARWYGGRPTCAPGNACTRDSRGVRSIWTWPE